jgi:antitoxin ParD1/3/4
MRNTSISLSDHWIEFTAKQVASGRYGSTSEVVRAGLRMIEERQRKIDALNAAIDEGLASDLIEDFDFDAYIEAIGDDDDGAQSKAA